VEHLKGSSLTRKHQTRLERLAYFEKALLTAVKSFKTLAPDHLALYSNNYFRIVIS
jgi:hypothetical protein